MRINIASGDSGLVSTDEAELVRIELADDRTGAVIRHEAPRVPPMSQGHRHNEWEFNLVTRGRAAYLVEGRRVPLELDSLLWLLPSQGHVLLDRSPDFCMWIVVVRPEAVRQVAADPACAVWHDWMDPDRPPPPPQHRLVGEAAARQLATLCRRLEDPPDPSPPGGDAPRLAPQHHAAGLAYLTAEAWAAFLAAPDRPAGSHLHPAVQTAVTWLADHAHTPDADDLDALAQRCHVSRPHLSRLFKQQTGQTLTDFRNRRRADRFAALLGRGGRLTATQAAYAAGFGSYAQAYRVVKQLTGRSPRGLLQPRPAEK